MKKINHLTVMIALEPRIRIAAERSKHRGEVFRNNIERVFSPSKVDVRRTEFPSRGGGCRPAGAIGWLADRFDFSAWPPTAPAPLLHQWKGLA